MPTMIGLETEGVVYVRVERSTGKDFWYANRVGEVFACRSLDETHWTIVDPRRPDNHTFLINRDNGSVLPHAHVVARPGWDRELSIEYWKEVAGVVSGVPVSCARRETAELVDRLAGVDKWLRDLDDRMVGVENALERRTEMETTDARDYPWLVAIDGEFPGGLCCQRATGSWCYEHDPGNWVRLDGVNWELRTRRTSAVDLTKRVTALEADLCAHSIGSRKADDDLAARIERLEHAHKGTIPVDALRRMVEWAWLHWSSQPRDRDRWTAVYTAIELWCPEIGHFDVYWEIGTYSWTGKESA